MIKKASYCGFLIMPETFARAEFDNEIISLTQHILGQPKSKSDPPPVQSTDQPSAAEIKVEARHESFEPPQAKVAKTAGELARMIEADLANIRRARGRVCGDGLR